MSSNTNTFLTPVKSTNFYVSEFVGSTTDPCFTKGLIESNPTIYKSGNSFFIDYSASQNSSDLKFLKRFFGSLTAGNTLSIVGGTYYIEKSAQKYNFVGTYTIAGYTGFYNNYINLSGITYPTNLSDGVYQAENFIEPIKFSAISGKTAQYFSSKVNKDDPYNVSFFGIYGNDYGIEEYFELTGSTLNSLRYKIDTAIKLDDLSEIVYINQGSTILSESFFCVPVAATVYMRGVPDIITLSQNKNLNGLLKKINSSGQVLQIFDKQNLHQRYCRSIADPSNYYDWYAEHSALYYQYIYNPIAYDGLSLSINYYSFIKFGTDVITTTSVVDDSVTQTNIPVLVVDGVRTSTASYQTQSVTNPILKLDLSDTSLYSTTIEPFLDAQCTTRLSSSFFLNGVPGFDGASFIYLKTNSSPSTIYLKFTKQVSLVLQIVV